MALHPNFPASPYAPFLPSQRWFPAEETLLASTYAKLLPPLVAKIRLEVFGWRASGYDGASESSIALLKHWFDIAHLTENADRLLSTFRYNTAQREAVDFDYESRKEIILMPKTFGAAGELPGMADSSGFVQFEEQWTGSCIFENERQSFRTRRDRDLELTSAPHTYPKAGRYIVAVKVIDIFGNDTTSLVPVTVG